MYPCGGRLGDISDHPRNMQRIPQLQTEIYMLSCQIKWLSSIKVQGGRKQTLVILIYITQPDVIDTILCKKFSCTAPKCGMHFAAVDQSKGSI